MTQRILTAAAALMAVAALVLGALDNPVGVVAAYVLCVSLILARVLVAGRRARRNGGWTRC